MVCIELAAGELGPERVCEKDFYIGRFVNLKTDLAMALLKNHQGRFTKTTSNHKLVRLRNITISSTGVLKSSNSTALRIL